MNRKADIRLHGSSAGVINTGTIGEVKSRPRSAESSTAAAPAFQSEAAQSSLEVFVSHAHEDRALADMLVAVLRYGVRGLGAEAVRCTSLAAHGLTAGVLVSSRLREEVTTAKVVLGILTPHSFASPYVLFELGAAWGADVPVIPLRVGTTDSLGPLDGYLSIILADEDAAERLVDAVAKATGRSCEPFRAYRKAASELAALTGSLQRG